MNTRPVNEISWLDKDGVCHRMSIRGATASLKRFWEEWPGGWSEVEAEKAALASRVAEMERHNKALVERREWDVRDIKKYSAMVGRLEGAMSQISEMTYDSRTNGAIAKQIADAALASKEHP